MVDARDVVIWSADVDERTLRATLTEGDLLENFERIAIHLNK